MQLHPYSTKQLNNVLNEDDVFVRLKKLLDDDKRDLDSLKIVGKICMMEFGIQADDWDKIMFLLKVASCCNENN